MYLLTRNNVDGYPSHDKFEEEPTEDQLDEIFVQYDDEEESRKALQKLLNNIRTRKKSSVLLTTITKQ